jgi:hypothetical protein
MDSTWRAILWQQLGGAIAMLENAITACPEPLWRDRTQTPEYWYLAFHTLFFLDLYVSGSVVDFAPPPPFNLDELDPAGVLPEQPYSQEQLQGYVEHCREKCHATMAALSDEQSGRRCRFDWLDVSFAEILLISLRHVQHHTAQMNLILRQKTGSAPRWVRKSSVPL